MKAIPREAGRITYSTEIRNLKQLPLSDIQMAVVIGSILLVECVILLSPVETGFSLIYLRDEDSDCYDLES